MESALNADVVMLKQLSHKLPVPQDDVTGDDRWMSQHISFLHRLREHETDVVFIGDSTIQMLQFFDAWNQFIEPLHVLNFGIAGDQAHNVLWRLQNGELLQLIKPNATGIGFVSNAKQNSHMVTETGNGCRDSAMATSTIKVLVLMVGAEHSVDESPEDIVYGIDEIVQYVINNTRNLAILVMGLLPCGRHNNRKRYQHFEVNRLLQSHFVNRPYSKHQSSYVQLLIPDWDQYLRLDTSALQSNQCSVERDYACLPDALASPGDEKDMLISHLDMFDYFHLTNQGFKKILDPLLDELQTLLQSFMKTTTNNMEDDGAWDSVLDESLSALAMENEKQL